MMKNFALIGAAGYIAPRHMQAIRDTGNRLVCALDPNDSVGIIDNYFPEADFFTEPERFDRHLDKLRRAGQQKIDYVSICSPNYLHDAHIRMALRNQAHAICEKPLVLNPWNLQGLQQLQQETGRNIYTILQLRLHPDIIALKDKIRAAGNKTWEVGLQYITSRGRWYHYSWKGMPEKSGGVATNIGVHFFDMLSWIFGPARELSVREKTAEKVSGILQLENARVNWLLSINAADLPPQALEKQQRTYRSITVEGQEVEFSEGFTGLHTRSYEEILAGRGFGIDEVRPSIEIVQKIREM